MIEQILEADRNLQVDQVEKARGMYQRVVDLDPGNAIAVVGLARCALAEGDDHMAYELAGRALELDPQNDMARRMEARLSEILTTRGETVERPDAAATPAPREMRAVTTEEAPADHELEAGSATEVGSATEPAPATPTTTSSPAAKPATINPAATTSPSATSTTTGEATRTPTPRKERPVHKSLFDRLLGR